MGNPSLSPEGRCRTRWGQHWAPADRMRRSPHLEAALWGDGEVRFDSQNPVCLFSSRVPSTRWLEMETQSLERGLGSTRGQE